MDPHLDVIATTISGSIQDWGKVKRILPLFRGHGMEDVELHTADSHREARERTRDLVRGGSRRLISAGGSGTFNAVLEGCIDAGVPLEELRLGFLRKGSADLIGKALGMPDEIEAAVAVFAEALRLDRTVPCDVLEASSQGGEAPVRHFVGYGGAGIFGEIPRFTENRFIKYYKGVLGQLFGDLGPFFVGTNLAVLSGLPRRILGRRRSWEIRVDGGAAASGRFQAMIIVNGDLGPDLPFAKDEPLGSGCFHLFTLRDQGTWRLYRQMARAFKGTIAQDPDRWGFESFRVRESLELAPTDGGAFPLNVDGSALSCRGAARVRIVDRIPLLSRPGGRDETV